MKFATVAVGEAEGWILAHSLSVGSGRLRKGIVLTADHARQLAAAGISSVMAALPEPDDMPEDAAASALALALAGTGVCLSVPTNGRCNLLAENAGLLCFDTEALHAVNLIDPDLTVGTRLPYSVVSAGQIIATIKVIPFAAHQASVAQACNTASPLTVRPFRPLAVRLVQTRLSGQKASVFEKTERVTAGRLARLGCNITQSELIEHDGAQLARTLNIPNSRIDLTLVVGASAIVDRGDVIPAAIKAAGGTLIRCGMPADPGNLLCLGTLNDQPVVGLPGCARSPKRNGVDLVLERIAAGLQLTSQDIARMGVGGLLDDTVERDAPRAPATQSRRKVGALVLAAGLSRRMAPENKLLADMGGAPVVRRVIDSIDAAGLPVVVILGHQAEEVRAASGDVPCGFAIAADYATGLSASLRAGIATIPADWDAVLVCLGDMPLVGPDLIRKIVDVSGSLPADHIAVPACMGKRGNPVVWPRSYFNRLLDLSGDSGAKSLMSEFADQVDLIDVDSTAIFADVDTPEALAAARAIWSGR